VLRILKDSRIGSFGLAGLASAMALRAGGLIAIADPWRVAVALVVAGAVGRLVILILMCLVPPVGDRASLSRDVGQAIGAGTVAAGALAALPVWALGLWADAWALVVAGALLGLFAVWFAGYLERRIGGITGDCLGMAAYAGIVVTTLAFALER
jgi:adenosylcobinamide-GDP ribazoletransferase